MESFSRQLCICVVFLSILSTSTMANVQGPSMNGTVAHQEDQRAKLEHPSSLSILDSLLKNYDRRATPTNHLGKATEVECTLYVRSLGSINPDTMDYQVDLYLRQHWLDPRLQHPKLVDPLDLNDPNLVKAIWKPEVYFPNAKDAEFQFVTVPNVLVRIDPGGQILYMLRLKLKFSCMMELSKFPLDEQICTMEIASFSKTTKELVLCWQEHKPVDISSEVKMPQFEIFMVIPDKCQETFHIGNYSCLLAKLHLKRSLGFHMVQSYLPTILIVVISWVSFWMDVDSVAGRTTLGVTTLLTVSSKSSDVQAEVPLVSYIKAIDIWMGACTAFIFAALLEFTLANYLWRKGLAGRSRLNNESTTFNLRTSMATVQPKSISNQDMPLRVKCSSDPRLDQIRGDGRPFRLSEQLDDEQVCDSKGPGVRFLGAIEDPSGCRRDISFYCSLAVSIDEWSRKLFPLAFCFFNILYWSYYTKWSVEDKNNNH